ncbi:MAG: hypothetical protein Q4C59_11640 [Lachnospiraceae bacterium]|nr:hypothetical protein [Lachnospiraceae bacterium]
MIAKFGKDSEMEGYCSDICRDGSRLTGNNASRGTEIAFHALTRC